MLQSYTTNSGGWYAENTGPLALRDNINQQIGEHETRSIYKFSEDFGLYDLSLQLAIKCDKVPMFEYLQGEEIKTAQCYNAPQVTAEDNDIFIICPCIIMPLKTNNSCSLIVDTTGSVNFAYKLLGWNYATKP